MKLIISHPWNLSIDEAKALQVSLSKKIVLEAQFSFYDIKSIAGCDISFNNKKACASIVLMSFPELKVIEQIRITKEVVFPYIPEYLSFREGPIIIDLLQRVKNNAAVFLFDSQGLAHPRRLGLASHIGVLFDIPTIGVAKSLLYGRCKAPGIERGSKSPIFSPGGEINGFVVRTRTNVKPVFVSCGHKINLDLAIDIVLYSSRFRIPEPIRRAHILSRC